MKLSSRVLPSPCNVEPFNLYQFIAHCLLLLHKVTATRRNYILSKMCTTSFLQTHTSKQKLNEETNDQSEKKKKLRHGFLDYFFFHINNSQTIFFETPLLARGQKWIFSHWDSPKTIQQTKHSEFHTVQFWVVGLIDVYTASPMIHMTVLCVNNVVAHLLNSEGISPFIADVYHLKIYFKVSPFSS